MAPYPLRRDIDCTVPLEATLKYPFGHPTRALKNGSRKQQKMKKATTRIEPSTPNP